MPRARMSRSELKAQDEITTTLERLTETAVERKNEVIVGLLVLLALVGGFFGWRYYSASQNAKAQQELSNVITAYQDLTIKSEKERFEKTIVAAQKTIADYPGSHAAFLAQYYFGGGEREVPKTIILSEAIADVALIESALQEASGHRVEITSGVRTHRARWLEMVCVPGRSLSAIIGTPHQHVEQPEGNDAE